MAPREGRPPAYKNLLLVTGCLLIGLGIGNWIVGAERAGLYLDYLRLHPGPRQTTASLKASLLEPPDEEREQRDINRAKLEFYQLVQSGGRLMVVIGALCLLGAIVNLTGTRRPAPLQR